MRCYQPTLFLQPAGAIQSALVRGYPLDPLKGGRHMPFAQERKLLVPIIDGLVVLQMHQHLTKRCHVSSILAVVVVLRQGEQASRSEGHHLRLRVRHRRLCSARTQRYRAEKGWRMNLRRSVISARKQCLALSLPCKSAKGLGISKAKA